MCKAKLIQFSLPDLIQGHPVIIFRCPGCELIVNENINADIAKLTSTIKSILTCSSCNKQLEYDITELRNIARYDIIAFTQRLRLSPTPTEYHQLLQEFVLAAIAVRGFLRIILLLCRTNRIGHVLQNTANFLAKLDTLGELDKCLIFGATQDIIANYTSLTSFWYPNIIFERWVRDAYIVCMTTPSARYLAYDIQNESVGYLEHAPYCIEYSLSAEDCAEGERRLGATLKNPQDSYVCFLGRDNLYLQKLRPDLPSDYADYHDCRNIDPDTFIPAMNYLSKNNITSFRMGSIVKKPLSITNNENIIDYASIMHSELMDFYLPMQSKFCVYSNTGIHMLPLLLRKPLLCPMAQYGFKELYTSDAILYLFKRYSLNGKPLTLIEVYQKNLHERHGVEDFTEQSVVVEDFLAEDILAATIEMNMRIDGTWVEDDEDKYIQARFKEIISKMSDMPIEEITSRISTSFCKRHPDFLLGDFGVR